MASNATSTTAIQTRVKLTPELKTKIKSDFTANPNMKPTQYANDNGLHAQEVRDYLGVQRNLGTIPRSEAGKRLVVNLHNKKLSNAAAAVNAASKPVVAPKTVTTQSSTERVKSNSSYTFNFGGRSVTVDGEVADLNISNGKVTVTISL